VTVVVSVAAGKQPWFWASADIVVAVLLLANLLLIAAVHGRRVRQYFRRRREAAFRAQVAELLAELDTHPQGRELSSLRHQVERFDEFERPIAAVMLIERLQPASDDERRQVLEGLREVGAIALLVRSTRRRMPWRRALAIRTLGWVGATEAVPTLIERASDRNRVVREAAVRALGLIGDVRALPLLGELLRSPGRVGAGVAYEALVAFGRPAEPVFAGAASSPVESVRVAACYGLLAVSEPEDARTQLVPLLDDPTAPVRAAAAESLGQLGGGRVPEGMARASRDEFPSVRGAAAAALGFFDDPRAVDLVRNALLDPNRDTAVRAGAALVRLSRLPAAGPPAAQALAESGDSWLVRRALIFDSLGAL
jgi:HEAT repeat protein